MTPNQIRETYWRTAGLLVLRNNGFMYVDEFDIRFGYSHTGEIDRVTGVDLTNEKERFRYELKGGDTWFINETEKQYERMREYLQRAGI